MEGWEPSSRVVP